MAKDFILLLSRQIKDFIINIQGENIVLQNLVLINVAN